MNVRRLLLLGLFGVTLPACGNHSSTPPPDPLQISAVGGSTSSDTALGNGHAGGLMSAFATGSITLTGTDQAPAAPAIPAPPSTGTELTNAMIAAGTPIAGNVRVSSTLQIAAGVNPATITTNTGDVIILGSLIGERSVVTTTNAISISAPAGTIYVLGSIHTSGTSGAIDNPNGGALTLTAQRIIVYGVIDSTGETNTSAVGGNAGSVTLDTTGAGGTDLLFTGGLIQASGGSGATQGGKGGNISLTAGGQLAVFAPVLTNGGAANSLASTPTAGAGGSITLAGNVAANVWTELSMAGGSASGFVAGAVGGSGGTFTAGSAAPYSIYGVINTSGGSASAHTAGAGSLDGGTAGPVMIGVATPVTSLQLGMGTYSTSGGSGIVAAGNAGGFDFESANGNIAINATMYARGVSANLSRGAGGPVTIRTDQNPAGNTSNHTLAFSGTIDSSGEGGGAVLIQCGSDLTFAGTLVSSTIGDPASAGAVTLSVAAANLPPTGQLSVTGTLLAEGSTPGIGLVGGSGGAVTFTSASGIAFSGAIITRGGGDPGGNAGSITMQSVSGDINLTGVITATGDSPFTTPPPTPGNLTVSTTGNITSSAVIDLSAEDAIPFNTGVAGAMGGTVTFTSTGPSGAITLQAGTMITANGGASNPGALNPPGGAGGSVILSTSNQPISISGTITARGGDAPTQSGGLGGQFVANSNSTGTGTGGSITLTMDSTIDVSGGMGFTGGSALNNGGVPPANSSGRNLAVIFDAAGGLNSSPDGTGGVVQNLGTITANGFSVLGRGGDIWFDGKNALGLELGPSDGGTLILSAPGGSGVFFPN